METSTLRHQAGLLLARIDGKSPVEYITAAPDKDRVRSFARAHLSAPAAEPLTLADRWFTR